MKWWLRMLLLSSSVLLGVTTLVFFIFRILPGDAIMLSMGQRMDPKAYEQLKEEQGLDRSLVYQYGQYLHGLSPIGVKAGAEESSTTFGFKKPALGKSLKDGREVSQLLGNAMLMSLVLALSSFTIAAILGLFLGSMAALRKNTFWDVLILFITNLGISLPSYFAAVIVAYLFGFVLNQYTGLSMTGNLYDVDSNGVTVLHWRHLILPSIALGIRPLAIITQMMRSSLIETMQSDFIRTARAKGLRPWTVTLAHGWRNAMNPVVTAMSSWFASLLAGAFFIESIFGWNGLGRATVEAIGYRDYPVVMGAVLYISLLYIVIHFLLEIVYRWLDPRISLSEN